MSESNKDVEPRSKLRALIVEDDKLVLGMLKVVIRLQGDFSADCAESTSEALRILREAKEGGRPFELVFSDLGLTDSADGGLEIAKVTKAEGLAKHFILFTGSAARFEGMSREHLKESGIDLVVDKPASSSVLEKCLSDAKGIINSPQTSQ